jgi:hypothetical protein
MNLGKQSNPIPGYVIGAAISALILCSPVIALLMLIAAEALIDLLLVAGTGAIYSIAAGVSCLFLFQKFLGFSPVTLIRVPAVPKS